MENKEKILVDGLWSYDIPDTAPDFVLGKTAFNVSKFTKFLAENSKYAVNGFLTIQVLRSKTGKRYAVLDTYDYEKKQSSEAQNGSPANGNVDSRFQFNREENLPIIDQSDQDAHSGENPVSVEDIPF